MVSNTKHITIGPNIFLAACITFYFYDWVGIYRIDGILRLFWGTWDSPIIERDLLFCGLILIKQHYLKLFMIRKIKQIIINPVSQLRTQFTVLSRLNLFIKLC